MNGASEWDPAGPKKGPQAQKAKRTVRQQCKHPLTWPFVDTRTVCTGQVIHHCAWHCVQCACAHLQPELPFPLLHGIELRSSKRASSIDIALPVDRNPRPPPGRWPFSPAPPISKHGGPYCPCDDLLFDLQEEPLTVQPTSNLEPPTSPSLPPPVSRHRRPTESTRRRPSSSISHPAFFTLTTIAFPTSIHGRNHQSTHSIARPPARPLRYTSISQRIGIADVPPIPSRVIDCRPRSSMGLGQPT